MTNSPLQSQVAACGIPFATGAAARAQGNSGRLVRAHAATPVGKTNLSSSAIRGLTVVELLVGVVITAALVALLLPGIQTSMENSKTIRCMANLKQMHTGFMLYIGDNNGRLPRYREGYYGPDGLWKRKESWGELIAPYLSPEKEKQYRICPATKKEQQTGGSSEYAMNCLISDDKLKPEQLQGVALPNERFLMTDSLGETRVSSAWRTEGAFRHPGKRTNLLFFDGHVESRIYEEIPIPDTGFPKSSPKYKAFWFGSL